MAAPTDAAPTDAVANVGKGRGFIIRSGVRSSAAAGRSGSKDQQRRSEGECQARRFSARRGLSGSGRADGPCRSGLPERLSAETLERQAGVWFGWGRVLIGVRR